MPLQLKEYKAFVQAVKDDKLKLADALKLLEKSYTDKNPVTDAFNNGRNLKACVTQTRKGKPPTDELSKREREKGFKVNTQERSRKFDDAVGRPSVE